MPVNTLFAGIFTYRYPTKNSEIIKNKTPESWQFVFVDKTATISDTKQCWPTS